MVAPSAEASLDLQLVVQTSNRGTAISVQARNCDVQRTCKRSRPQSLSLHRSRSLLAQSQLFWPFPPVNDLHHQLVIWVAGLERLDAPCDSDSADPEIFDQLVSWPEFYRTDRLFSALIKSVDPVVPGEF